jgi:hypothetical protein
MRRGNSPTVDLHDREGVMSAPLTKGMDKTAPVGWLTKRKISTVAWYDTTVLR